MHYSDINQPKPETSKSTPMLDEGDNPVLPGVPHSVAQAFLRGLDDVKHNRVVDGDAVIAESRTLLAEHREKKRKDGTSFTNGS